MPGTETLKILLSGANRGLGLALSEYFIQNGHKVYALLRKRSPEISTLQQSDLGEIDFSVYAPTLEVNAIAPLKVVEVFLPLILAGHKRLIVNITSEAGSIGNMRREREYAYCMSKAALNMASKILDNRLRREGIKVLALHPGWFSSDMGGGDAPITPRQAAFNVGRTILKDRHSRKAVYVDARGRKLPW
jgi:NAD(P)-dependent dehydrogenase (short-subunit alcohol dehydrogenase family)